MSVLLFEEYVYVFYFRIRVCWRFAWDPCIVPHTLKDGPDFNTGNLHTLQNKRFGRAGFREPRLTGVLTDTRRILYHWYSVVKR